MSSVESDRSTSGAPPPGTAGTINFYQITDQIGTSGQPDRNQLVAIANEGYETVINLAVHDAPSAIPEEGSICASLGMNYINIPVPFSAPTLNHLQQFCGIMQGLAGRRIWVHCEVNARVSAFMYQYLTLVQGVSPDAATTPLLTQGRHQMDPVWTAFLELRL
jgi:protein tyrosine phosphatase (PTP) superfamily phosphohydrolase (DUF442 family)